MKMTVLRKLTGQKDVAGKRYKVTINEGLKKIERSYELITKSKSLDQYSPEDQEVFRKIESDLTGSDTDFAGLEDEINRL